MPDEINRRDFINLAALGAAALTGGAEAVHAQQTDQPREYPYQPARFITEPQKQRPVLYEADVVVAGSGLCSTFAAIAAGRLGAKVAVIDRFGSLGGSVGPGYPWLGTLDGEAEYTLPGGLSGIPKEFMQRLRALRVHDNDNPEDSRIASYVADQMMREAGVELVLSAYAADPIMDGNTVRGLFVECKSGRAAIPAMVTIDGTGDADIAARAGAKIVHYLPSSEAPPQYIRPPHNSDRWPTLYEDTHMLCVVAGVDLDAYEQFAEQNVEISPEDQQWREEHGLQGAPTVLIPALREAWESGEFRPRREIAPGVELGGLGPLLRLSALAPGLATLHIACVGAIDPANPVQVSLLEARMRAQAFETIRFLRKHAPGFEQAYLLHDAPFLGFRGGPHIEGDHTITLQEMWTGRKFDDVLYRNTHEKDHGGDPSGYDFPYSAVLPRGIDGLLVCGRGAAYVRRGHEPTGARARPAMMVFGQTVGTAAAIAALDGVTPRNVDLKKVQRRLIADGIFLGEPERLRELGLA
jgi:hypothetical protein